MLIGSQNKITPIAKNESYGTFNSKNESEAQLNYLRCLAEAAGGEFYESEDAYRAAETARLNELESASKRLAANLSAEAVVFEQTVTVLDKLTDNPIKNAIVRLDGIPRYYI